jgi:hypothetical protein
MTLPTSAAAPVNTTLNHDFADISPSSLFVRPRPVWVRTRLYHVNCISRECINPERVFLLKTNEPPRDCRRLQLLRRWSHDEQDDE